MSSEQQQRSSTDASDTVRVRFINSNEPVTTFYRDLVPHLSELGHSVEIITSRAEYRLNRDLDGAVGRLRHVSIVKTSSLFVKEYNKKAWTKALVRGLYAVQGFWFLLTRPSVDLNVFLTQPPFFHALGPILRRVRGQEYVCVVMDVQPQQYAEFGILRKGSAIYRLLYWLSAWGYSNAERNIVIGRCMAERLIEMGVDEDSIELIPNWTNELEFTPIERDKNKLRIKQSWGDDFVVTYGGNIGFAQEFDVFVDAAQLLQDTAGIRFVLIGGGTRASHYQGRIKELGLTNFEILPFLHDEFSLAEIYGAGDTSFISLKHSCTGLGVPSKAYNTLAAGRPIVYFGRADGEIARMVTEEGIGVVADSASSLADAILMYAEDRERRESEGDRARHLSETIYSRGEAMVRYQRVLERSALKREQGAP